MNEQEKQAFEKWWPNGWIFGNPFSTKKEDEAYEKSFREVAEQAFQEGIRFANEQADIRP
jgi:hypothetical protein